VRSVSSTPGSSVPRPVRLLLVTDSLEIGGAERHVVDLALALWREGYNVTVACSVAGPLSEPLEREGVPVRTLLKRLVKRRVSVAYASRLRKQTKATSREG
jgi:predicted transcriptional regulator